MTVTTVQPPALEVSSEQADRWQRALTLGQERRLAIIRQHERTTGAGQYLARFSVASQSQPGLMHYTAIAADPANNLTYTKCDCAAGHIPQPCVHAALVLEDTQMWPFPILSQTDMEILDGAAGVRILLADGGETLVSAEDAERVQQFKWRRGGQPYAWTSKRSKGVWTKTYLQRFIVNAPVGMVVDHINHDPLDNRRENLRLCTQQENSRNNSTTRGKSQYRGVHWNEQSGKWRVTIYLPSDEKRRKVHVGSYDDEVEAARAFDAATKEHYGAFANPNFPESDTSIVNSLEPERPATNPVELAPAWFKVGQAVRPHRSRNTFWVRAVIAEQFGWVYELEDLARNAAGRFGESSLTLATSKRQRAA